MTSDSSSSPSTRTQLADATLAIYASITLLGVIAAASWKGLLSEEQELLAIIVGTSITLAVAHAWAAVAAHRLVHSRALTASERRAELRGMAVIMAVGAAATTAFGLSALASDNFEQSVRMTLLVLITVLFLVGIVGSRRRGDSWLRAVGWGLADASIGLVVLVVKVLVGS